MRTETINRILDDTSGFLKYTFQRCSPEQKHKILSITAEKYRQRLIDLYKLAGYDVNVFIEVKFKNESDKKEDNS